MNAHQPKLKLSFYNNLHVPFASNLKFLIVTLLCIFFVSNANSQNSSNLNDSIELSINETDSILLVRDSLKVTLTLKVADSIGNSIVLWNLGDSIDLDDSLLLNSLSEDTNIKNLVRSTLKDNYPNIADTLNLTKTQEGRLAFIVSSNDQTTNTTNTPPFSNSSDYIIDRFSFVINNTDHNVTVLQSTTSTLKEYKVTFQNSNNNQSEIKTYNVGKRFYPDQFTIWLNLSFPNINLTAKSNLTDRITENLSLFQIQNATQISNNLMSDVIDSTVAEALRPLNAGKFVLNGSLSIPVYGKDSNAWELKKPLKNKVFLIDNVRIATDYNRISDLRFSGYYIDTLKRDSTRVSFSNRYFSIGLAKFNQHKYAFGNNIGLEKVYINPRKMLTYEPIGSTYTYTVRNEEVALNAESRSATLHRRNFSDYIALQIFLDPLGFFNDLPNGFTQIEGSAYVPMNNVNYKKHNLLMKSKTSFSYVFTNAVSSEPRFAKFDSTLFQESIINDSTSIRTGLINNLDFLRNYFYQLSMKFTLYSVESKNSNSWMHINSGFRLIGSRVGPNRDSLRTYHKLLIEMMSLSLEIRPDRPFGLNVDVGFSFLNTLRKNTNRPNFPFDPQFLYEKSVLIPHEFNFYHYLSDHSKGGLFFRYAGYLNFNRKLRGQLQANPRLNLFDKSSDYFPLLLIGYSTNISALVKGEFFNRGANLHTAIQGQ